MKIKRLSKGIISVIAAFCLILGALVPVSFALVAYAYKLSDMRVVDCIKTRNPRNTYYIVCVDPKYVTVSDDIVIKMASPIYDGQRKIVTVSDDDYLIEKRNTSDGECFVITIKYASVNHYVNIAENSFFDSEGNSNEEFLGRYEDPKHLYDAKDFYSYSVYDTSFTVTPPGNDGYTKPSLGQGKKIELKLNGSFNKDYKVYLDDELVSTGGESVDVKFNSTGKHTLKMYFNDLLNEDLTFDIIESSAARASELSESFELLTGSLKLFPLGIVFLFNPLTLIPGATIVGSFFVGIAGIFKSLFVWQ